MSGAKGAAGAPDGWTRDGDGWTRDGDGWTRDGDGWTRRGALTVALLGTLAGCGLEPDPTIRPGREIDTSADEGLTYVPPGPQPSDGPEETVLGFMRAGATTGSELSVARSFLTDEAGGGWIPDSQTVVYGTTAPSVTRTGPGRYRADIRVIARIDADGRYLVAPPYDGATFDFGVRQSKGRWFIDTLQDGFGRVLARSAVSRMYRAYSVHYPAIGWNALVGDQRWVLQDQLATRLARAQLGRVPAYLSGAVQTDADAELSVDAVPVVGGAALVDLDPRGLSQDATVRKQFAAQLVATLNQPPDVSEVAITVAGAPLELSIGDAPLTSPEQLGFVDRRTGEQQALARVGSHLHRVPSGKLSSLRGDDLAHDDAAFTVARGWQELALSPDGREIAGISAARVELARWRDDGTVVPVPRFARELTRPSYDYGGVLWVAGRGLGSEEGNVLWAINALADTGDARASAPVGLATRWLDSGRQIQTIAVSPEGSRLAVVSAPPEGGASILEVVGIARSANGLPTSTSDQALRGAARLVEIEDIVWVGPTTLAVIGREDKERAMTPRLVSVGGEITGLAPRPGAERVTTLSGARDIVVSDNRRRCWVRTGARWSRLDGIDAVVVAGV